MGLSKCLRVLKAGTGTKLSTLVHNKSGSGCLLFESNQLMELSQAEFSNRKRELGYLPELDAYGIIGVLNTFLECETDGIPAIKSYSYLLVVKECQRVAVLKNTEVYLLTSVQVVPLTEDATPEIANSVKRLLSLKVFYFSWSPNPSDRWDLTRSASKQSSQNQKPNPSYIWNKYLMTSFHQFGISTVDWLIELVCGFAEEKIVYSGSAQVRCCLLTRLSSNRAGARLSTRGIDTEGRVALFAETEQLVSVTEEGVLASFIQIRGSVPLFWEQRSYQVEQNRISFTRRFHCTTPAFLRHFRDICGRYGRVLILDLLGKRESEFQLKSEFKEHLKTAQEFRDSLKYVNFDFLELCKGGKRDKLDVLWNSELLDQVQANSCFYEKRDKTSGLVLIVSGQAGVVRTNCFDCLDRTNALQTYIGLKMAVAQTEQIIRDTASQEETADRTSQCETRIEEAFASLWHHNGNNLSRLFTGTTALHSSHTKSKLSDTGASVARALKASQLEGVMQEGFALLLGQATFGIKSILTGNTLLGKNIIQEPVTFLQAISSRADEFSLHNRAFTVGVATYNVNGGKHTRSYLDKANSLSEWINIPEHQPPDLFAIGFEELVEITTKNLISTSSSHRKSWEQELTSVLSARHPYHLLTAEQLVGTCLYLFIKQELVDAVLDTDVCVVKTGMSGKAGNKGSIGVYVQLRAARYCFICSHFAAHQDKVNERNADYIEACKKLEFTSRYGPILIEDMDYVFWCGDFNYRIDMPREQVHSYVQSKSYGELLKADQLKTQIYDGCVFHGFCEGEIEFPPTFKYDVFTDRYDTSAKQRIPAWTDRILWRCNRNYNLEDKVSRYKFLEIKKRAKGMFILGDVEPVVNPGWSAGVCLCYRRSELKASDHRPVVAYIQCDNVQVDEDKLLQCVESITADLGPLDNTVCLEIDERKSPNASVHLDTILAFIGGIGTVTTVKVLDSNCILVRLAEFSQSAKILQLDGCQIDGKFVRISAAHSWESIVDVIKKRFTEEILSPQVEMNIVGQDALPLAGLPLLNLPLRRVPVSNNRSPLPVRHRPAEPAPSADSILEQAELNDVVRLDAPLVPTLASDRAPKPSRPNRPSRPISVYLSSPNQSDSDTDIPSYKPVSKIMTPLTQSLSLEVSVPKPTRPPRPSIHSPQPIKRLSPELFPHRRSNTVSVARPPLRPRTQTEGLYSLPSKGRGINPALRSLVSIEDTLNAALNKGTSLQYSDDSASPVSDLSDEDSIATQHNTDSSHPISNNSHTDTPVYATVHKPPSDETQTDSLQAPAVPAVRKRTPPILPNNKPITVAGAPGADSFITSLPPSKLQSPVPPPRPYRSDAN